MPLAGQPAHQRYVHPGPLVLWAGRLCGVLPAPQPAKPLTSCTLAGPKLEYLYVTNGDKIFRRKVQATANLTFKTPAAK